ncbi:MAG: hypothetical protein WC654_04820 [Patescibacteria group bacterium]
MNERIYDVHNLPELVPRSDGVAHPKPGAQVAACRIPVQTEFVACDGHTQIGKPGVHWHLAFNDQGEHYPNDEFECSHVLGERLDANDPRAKFLLDFWVARGYTVEVYMAYKSAPLKVIGILVASGIFQNVQGTGRFDPGDVLVESPMIKGRMWTVRRSVFDQKYQSIQPDDP